MNTTEIGIPAERMCLMTESLDWDCHIEKLGWERCEMSKPRSISLQPADDGCRDTD